MLSIRAARQFTTVPLRLSRYYSEGSVAKSREFGGREKAQEDKYAREHEQILLKKLRDDIQKKKDELAELEKKHEEVAKK